MGLGLMGLALAERFQYAGLEVVGWDIARVQRAKLKRLGGTVARDPDHVFDSCDRVVLSLPDSDVVARVLEEAKRSIRPGQLIVDTSTGDPLAASLLAARLKRRGIAYLDATISGNSAQLRRGDVLVMAGGSKQAFEACQGLFATFAARTIHTGASGAGARMKLVTNLVLGLNRAALAEGIAFARALGLDDEQTLAVLKESMAYSRIMDAKGQKMLRGEFSPQARLSQHLKDVRLMLKAASRGRASLPLTRAHRRLLERAEAAGWGSLDNSAIIRVIEDKGSGMGSRTRLRSASSRRAHLRVASARRARTRTRTRTNRRTRRTHK